MKVAIYTLGCKVNQYDSQEIGSLLKKNGFEIVSHRSEADVYIINSCTVTAESTRKSKQAVRRFKNLHPTAITVLTGCFPQAFTDELSDLAEADIIIGNRSNSQISALIRKYTDKNERYVCITPHNIKDKYVSSEIDTFEEHTRAFVKIQDGCNRYCSYCTIPKARGFSRSRPIESIKNELLKLACLGYSEIVFVGINLSAYGVDNGLSLFEPLNAAQQIDGIKRIRLGSLEPDHITDDLIDKMKTITKLCPHFHLSLQSGSDSVLKQMNRHYTTDEYFCLCQKLHKAFPDTSITTDIIVGFPGETEDDFNKTLDFAKKCKFMKVHVFPFSPRKGTPAYSYKNKVPSETKSSRCAVLQKSCDETRNEILSEYKGKITEVLFETPKNGFYHGYTANYTPIIVKSDENLTGKFFNVLITDIDSENCIGELAQNKEKTSK